MNQIEIINYRKITKTTALVKIIQFTKYNYFSYPIMACLKAFSQSELMALHFVVSSKLWATKASWDLVGKCWVDSADDDDKCWGDSIFVVILIVDNNFGGPYLKFLTSSEKKQKKCF